MNTILRGITRLAAASCLVIAMGVVAGCDSILDKPPLGQLTSETFLTLPEHGVQATNATYSQLRIWGVHVFPWIGMTDIASDDATKGSTPADAPFLLELDNLNFDAGNTAFTDTWTAYYQGIYRANYAIEGIPTIPNMDAALQQRLTGENKFLRAYFYFFLARAYGNVPLITAPLRPGEYEQPGTPQAEVYAQIVRDLRDAIEVLPVRYPAAEVGRATRGAAQGLLAQVYLYMKDYPNAEVYARAVIDSGEYGLLQDYGRLFTRDGENSSESLFEVQATRLETGGASSQYSEVQGVRGNPNLGWGFNQPSDQLDAAFEPGDFRHGHTILFPWELLPDGSGLHVFANATIDNQRYNQKAFVSPGGAGGTANAGMNIRRLRYADVLLIAAEAAFRNGRTGDAQTFLNQVRQRARGNQAATIGVITEDIAAFLATHTQLEESQRGVMVRRSHPNGPALGQGIESARFGFVPLVQAPIVEHLDIITAVDGVRVTSNAEYLQAIGGKSIGESVTLDLVHVTVARQGNQWVRTRTPRSVTVSTIARLPDVTASGDALLQAIWQERRVELAMEQHRWFDIIRQGRAPELMSAAGKTFVPGRHELYPIPQREIDLSAGLLQQNPGY
jgi:hypothetical protein